MIQDILIYGGIGLNIAGAVFLMAYAMKYFYALRKAEDKPIEKNALVAQWRKKRAVGFGLMIVGCVVVIISCSI